MSQSPYAALEPRAADPAVERIPLAERRTIDGPRIVLVKSMPPGSGVGTAAAMIGKGIRETMPEARCTEFARQTPLVDSATERAEVAGQADLVVYVAGPAATMVAVGAQFCSGLEAAGVPTAMVVFEALEPTLATALAAVGAPLRTVVLAPAPRIADSDRATVASVLKVLEEPLTETETSTGVHRAQSRPEIAVSGTLEEVNAYFETEQLTDGLPIYPPTRDRVDALLAATSRDAGQIVSENLMPLGRRVTVGTVAVNAAMAGLPSALFAHLLAAVAVMGDKNFESMTRSVNSFAFPLEVGGPGLDASGINGRLNALGPGNRHNTALARALGLVVRNGGGAVPGLTGSPTQGSPVAFSMAFAENPDSPWGPPDAELPDAEGDWVSVYVGGFSHAGNLYYEDIEGMGRILGGVEMPAQGVVAMLSLKRAKEYAALGLSRSDVEDLLHRSATMRLGDFRANGFFPAMKSMMTDPGPMRGKLWPLEYLSAPDDEVVPAVPRQNLLVRVVGGEEASVAQIWWIRRHCSVPVDPWR